MSKSKIIGEYELNEELQKEKQKIAEGIYSKLDMNLPELLVYLKYRISRLYLLKNKEIVNQNSLLSRCVSGTCMSVVYNGNYPPNILDKYIINGNTYTLTIKQFSKLPLAELTKENFSGLKPSHIRELKETMKSVGLTFKK